MRPIPPKLKKEIDADEFFKKCCLTGHLNPEINHNFIYAGKQINELWALTPIIKEKHRVDSDSYHKCRETRERVDLIALNRATPENFKKYPKRDWKQYKDYLIKKYGV